jgi:hypothetical protein
VVISQARNVAVSTLLGNIHSLPYSSGKEVKTAPLLVAAATKFKDTWPRDVLRDPEVLLTIAPEAFYGSLAATLENQSEDGRLPRRLSNVTPMTRNIDSFRRRFFGHSPKREGYFKPEWYTGTWNNFVGRKLFGPRSHPVDTYAIVLIALAEGSLRDPAFATLYEPYADKAISYLDGQLHGGLLRHPPHGGWNDHLHLDAFLAEQQMDLQHMYSRMADMKDSLGRIEEATDLRSRADILRDTINEVFWDERRGHYIFAIDPLRETMSVLANSRAIIYGIADADKSARIIDNFKRAHAAHRYMPLHTPQLPKGDMKLLRRWVMEHYLSGEICLPWNQAVAAEAASYVDKEFAAMLLEQIGHPLVEYRSPEILRYHHGKLVPLEGGLLSGQGYGFSWGAKAFIKAADTLEQQLRKAA